MAAVCSGFLYAVSVADSMLRTGAAEHALVIGSETFSRILDWEDRTTCVLFGDGAGAVVLSAKDVADDQGILATRLHAEGQYCDMLYVDGGPSTVDQHANTSAASVPLALDLAVRDGRIKRGDLVVLEAMGGGFTWGAAVLRV